MAEITIERVGKHVALMRFERPEARNALNMSVRQQLADAFRALGDDAEIRAIVLSGTAEAFAAGADLKEMADLDAVGALHRRTHELARPIFECRKPVIAAVRGFALGGGFELAMQCDILVVGEGAKLGLPEVRVGVMPGGGGTQRLLRLVGKHRAMLLALTGRMISGKEAAEWGIASLVVADDAVVATALETAERIAELPPIGVQLIKEAILAGQDQSLDAALALERRSFQFLFATEDRSEGVAAFVEKRKPTFKGK
jgi:enoyl-CoA hydratase/carnithine racemase